MRIAAIAIALASMWAAPSSRAAWSASPVAGVGFDQRIGESLPLEGHFRDAEGRDVRLGDFFGRLPVVVVFGYTRCPQLCSVVANGAVDALRAVSATAGRDFRVIYLSIDPTDTSRELAAAQRRDVGRYGRNGAAAGWDYLAADEATIHAVTAAAGFRYTFDARQKLYAHPSGFLVATPDGRISQYFLGVDFDAHELASGLERAAAGKTGQPVFNLLLACARGLGISGRYGKLIWACLTAGVVVTVGAVAGGIGWMLRAERRAAGKARST